ncbi:hypothetical protein [Mucilaginibacter sp. UR6-11]|uniref:hypothetical protein n=1 Tax=Mucilaginibacter sp. UR6-11 TaxID=1435644 RepID=UPI001E32DDFF|nr:hypothetical protein [Mucilaginibacter sp. UR6-11]MCC8426731.1 hypothetical protein [Mucilaginibacter sp. UR6-11]
MYQDKVTALAAIERRRAFKTSEVRTNHFVGDNTNKGGHTDNANQSGVLLAGRQPKSFGRKQVKQAGPCGGKGIGNFAWSCSPARQRRQKDRALQVLPVLCAKALCAKEAYRLT